MMPPGAHRQRDARTEFVRPISFWHAEQVRIFAKESGLPYDTDEQKWVARDKLRRKWERVAGLLPLRDHKDALRGLAQTQGQFDVPPQPTGDPILASDIVFATAEPSPSGMNAATPVPQQVAAFEREEQEDRARGRPWSEQKKAKIRRDRRQKKMREADDRAEAATEEVKERMRQASSRQDENRAQAASNDAKPRDPDFDIDTFLNGDD